MKILFIGQATNHFSYYKESLIALLRNKVSVELRYDNHFSKSFCSKFDDFCNEYNLDYKWIETNSILLKIKFFIRELRTYAWYLNRSDQSLYYTNRWAELIPFIHPLLKLSWIKFLIKQNFVSNFLNFINKILPIDSNVMDDVLSVSPDIIIISPGNMRYSKEIEYINVANKLNIMSVIFVLSWDNLTNKGLFHYLPNLFIVWNKHHYLELIKLHNIDSEKIFISGAQLFDKWFNPLDKSFGISKYINLLPSKYILYLGSSINIVKDESDIINKLSIQLKSIDNDLCIIFKPHPSHYEFYKNINLDNVILLPKDFGLSQNEYDVQNFKKIVLNSKYVIGINTSGFLDSIIINKRTFSLLDNRYSDTQINSAHYKILKEYKVLEEVRSINEITDDLIISRNFRSNRKLFLNNFVRPIKNGKSSGENACDQIINYFKNKI